MRRISMLFDLKQVLFSTLAFLLLREHRL